MTRLVQRCPFRLIRWSWEYEHEDGSCSGGWTTTKWGARREIQKARTRDYDRLGKHRQPAVGWPEIKS